MHAVDGSSQGVTRENRTGVIARERRKTIDGSAVGGEGDRKFEVLGLEKI